MSEPPKLSVLNRQPPLTDVPARLEDLASRIREGKIPATIALVVLADDNDAIDSVRCFGNVIGPVHSLGLLQFAAHDLVTTTMKKIEA